MILYNKLPVKIEFTKPVKHSKLFDLNNLRRRNVEMTKIFHLYPQEKSFSLQL